MLTSILVGVLGLRNAHERGYQTQAEYDECEGDVEAAHLPPVPPIFLEALLKAWRPPPLAPAFVPVFVEVAVTVVAAFPAAHGDSGSSEERWRGIKMSERSELLF